MIHKLLYTLNAILKNLHVEKTFSIKWEYYQESVKIYKSEESEEVWMEATENFRKCYYTGVVQIDCGINGWHDYKGDKLYVVGTATMIL